ncbi:hypothetical protein [Acinetobacter sp. GG2]|uniref:hypothetical protein n=1 Tax=Acinetobacter sp. GG2 TaxID=651305 RepID=UPI000368857E|nr:hypothetical protein [Acinetobacter sp. GG2]
MKKNYFLISSAVLLLVLSTITYQLYRTDDNQRNIKFRTDIQQDTQVKNNQIMAANEIEIIKEKLKNDKLKKSNDNDEKLLDSKSIQPK